jgi:hypothetical protein
MWRALHAPWKRSWRGTAPSVHEVLQHFEQTEDSSKFPVLCDCPAFWSSNSYCKNIVALYHYLDIIDVFEMIMSVLQPDEAGPSREKAPERDRDVED